MTATTDPLSFTVGEVDTLVGSLTSPNSSNPTLVTLSNIVFGGSGANRTITVTPVAGQSGSAIITVSVSDGQYNVSTNFELTVNSLFAGTISFTSKVAITISDAGAGTLYSSIPST